MKYEEVYLKDYANGFEAQSNISDYFLFYNQKRPHQAHMYRTPQEVYFDNPRMKSFDRVAA